MGNWRRLLRDPWTVRRCNQSILQEISPEYSLEGLMLKLQYFGHLMRKTDSLEKTGMLGKIEGGRRGDNRGWDGWMASLTHGHEFELALGVGDGQGGLACCSPWGRKESDMTERLNRTELNWLNPISRFFRKNCTGQESGMTYSKYWWKKKPAQNTLSSKVTGEVKTFWDITAERVYHHQTCPEVNAA